MLNNYNKKSQLMLMRRATAAYRLYRMLHVLA